YDRVVVSTGTFFRDQKRCRTQGAIKPVMATVTSANDDGSGIAVNDKSSIAKSLPLTTVLLSTIRIVAVVALPEFQERLKFTQLPAVVGATAPAPSCVPLTKSNSTALLVEGNVLATQPENW